MSYLTHVGSFNIDTSKTVGQTQSITGVGFQPKIVLFWWGGSTATGDSVSGGTHNLGMGAATSSTRRYCVDSISEDAQASSVTGKKHVNTQCIVLYTDRATIDGSLDFATFDADGFTLTVDDQFTRAYRISYLALGGDDLTNVYLGSKSAPTVTGNYEVTGVGFHPDALITFTCGINGDSGASNNAVFSVGMATASDHQGAAHAYSETAATTSNTEGYGYNGEITSLITTGFRDTFVSFGDDGFTLNHLAGASARTFFFIALKGGQYSVGDIATLTDGSDISETIGFQPAALLFASANRALSTQATATAHARLSIGAATSTSERACAAISDEDNLADTETAFSNSDSLVYQQIVDDAQVGGMDLKSIDASGFTCVMDDPDPSGCWVTYLAIGPAAGAMQATVAATAAVTATLKGEGALAAAVPAAGAVTATLKGDGALAASIAAAGSVTADLTGIAAGAISATVAAIANVVATLTGEGALEATLLSQANITATLTALGGEGGTGGHPRPRAPRWPGRGVSRSRSIPMGHAHEDEEIILIYA